MKIAVIPEVQVEQQVLADMESVLAPGETLSDFVEAALRGAIAFRRVQITFAAGAHQAAEGEVRAIGSVAAESLLDRLQAKLDQKRLALDR